MNPTYEELQAQLASLKQENERWQAADSKAVAALQSQLDENEKELAQLQLENERLKENQVHDEGTICDLRQTDYSQTLSIENLQASLAQLQLENGVMRSALERINEYCNDPSCGSVSKHALSTSTKSSLMEKVHSLLNALKPFEQRIDGWRKHLKKGSITEPISKEWLAVESALTEVKKEMV